MSTSQQPILKFALIGGVLSALILFAGTYLLGSLGDAEAIRNLREIRPTVRFTASGAMTATATILALMLTLLSFSSKVDQRIKAYHFERIHWIARLSAGTFIAALILLMVLNIPIENAEESFATIYDAIYYFIIAYVALLGGAITTVVLLLYNAVTDVINLAHPSRDSSYLYEKMEEE